MESSRLHRKTESIIIHKGFRENNSKNLNLDKEKKEVHWDAKEEIERNWEAIYNSMKEYLERGEVNRFLEMAAAVKIANPDINFKLTNKKRIDDNIEATKKNKLFGDFFSQAMWRKIIDPEFKAAYGEEELRGVEEELSAI